MPPVPDVGYPLSQLAVSDCAQDQIPRLRATAPHRVYGPHEPANGPTHVTVRGPRLRGKKRPPPEHDEPIPEILVLQRKAINERAAARPATTER